MNQLTTLLLLILAYLELSVAAPSGNKNVIIQMFEWTWDSIAAECTDFIGPAGYGFVQGKPVWYSGFGIKSR